jgi:hypothetical protein
VPDRATSFSGGTQHVRNAENTSRIVFRSRGKLPAVFLSAGASGVLPSVALAMVSCKVCPMGKSISGKQGRWLKMLQ